MFWWCSCDGESIHWEKVEFNVLVIGRFFISNWLPHLSLSVHTPRVCPINISHRTGVHSCITACVSWHHRAASTAVDDPTTFPKNKHTFLPADLWIWDASVGAHQFKWGFPLCASLVLAGLLYGGTRCGWEQSTHWGACEGKILQLGTYCRTLAPQVNFGWAHGSPS